MRPAVWTARCPKKAGSYWTRVVDGKRTIVCVREVTRHPEHGLVVHPDPTTPEMSMGLAAWAANWKAWWSGPVEPAPTV